MYTSQVRKFPSIFIQVAVDLTLELEPQEKGVVGAIGKLWIGNPYVVQTLTGASEPLYSTNINAGGSLDNELAYHIKDFFSGFNGKMQIGRVLGADSTTKVLEVIYNIDTFELSDLTDVNVFGANNINDWDDTVSAEVMEIVVKACPSEKVSIYITNVADFITVKMSDKFGNSLYEVSGGAHFDSLDDSGVNNYIGNVTDSKIMSIKVDTAHADYAPAFNVDGIVKEFATGLLTDTGLTNYDGAIDVLKNKIERCDYAITGGITDTTVVQALRAITFEAKTLLVVDIKGATLADAVASRVALNMNEEDVCFIWNRAKNVFPAGVLNIGLSGWFVGQSVKRNLSKLEGNVEYRVSGVAGVDFEVPRLLTDDLPVLSYDDKDILYDNRLNTVETMSDKMVIGNVLSGNPKNVSLQQFPVSEGNTHLRRLVAEIMVVKLFKNRNEAVRFIDKEVTKMMKRANVQDYFDNDIELEERFGHVVTKVGNKTIEVSFFYFVESVMTHGIVRSTLK